MPKWSANATKFTVSTTHNVKRGTSYIPKPILAKLGNPEGLQFVIQGKSALIVGGGQGMGESTAKLLASVGCNIAIADIIQKRAERVADMITKLGQQSIAIQGDAFNDDQAEEMVTRANQELGGLDLLVTTIGQASFSSAINMTPEQWDYDQRKNLRYFFVISRAVAKTLIANNKPGSIVGISSVNGMQSSPNHAAYGAAKAGMINLVRSLAVEWAPYNIRVNCIAPGSIITPRIPATADRIKITKEGLIPTKRLGTTDEVGKAALFLLSDMASYITGHTLLVDGGWMAAYLLGNRPPPPF